jgi:outer membrane protein assembly factor BamB
MRLASACLLALVVAGPVRAEDWPRFRGPRGDGTSAESDLPLKWGPKDNIAWKVALPGMGASSPIVVGDRIFVTCFSGKVAKELVRHVLCFDRKGGKLLWKNSYAAPLPENDYIKQLTQHGFATSTPVSDGTRVYVHFGRDGVRAFDLDGKLLWHEQVGKIVSTFGSGSSPILFGDKLIVNATVELAAVVALDKQSGKRLWKARVDGDCWSTPAVVDLPDGKKELVLNGSAAIYGFDPEDGKELWFMESVGGHISSTPVIRDGIIYVINAGMGERHVMAIRPGGKGDVSKTHVVWRQPKAGASHCSPLLLGDRLVYLSGQATAVSTKDGRILEQKRLDGLVNLYASPIVAGDKILLFTRQGEAYVLSAKNLEILARNSLGDTATINASPALSGGQIFIRSDRYLYCIGAGR